MTLTAGFSISIFFFISFVICGHYAQTQVVMKYMDQTYSSLLKKCI